MKRRGFLGLVAGAAAWPLAVPAQQGGGMRRLSVLAGYAANDSLGQLLATILPQSLTALGWSEGQNIHLDWRWANGDPFRRRYWRLPMRWRNNDWSGAIHLIVLPAVPLPITSAAPIQTTRTMMPHMTNAMVHNKSRLIQPRRRNPTPIHL